jgi:hypothetical protein
MRARRTIIILLITLQPFLLLAQDPGEPCGNQDIDNTTPCPLDSWVMILALIVVSFAAFQLYRNKKSLAV